MKKVLTLLVFITAVLITACGPKYEAVNGCEISPKTECSKFDVSEANLKGANLRGAEYNYYTQFHEGFDKKAAGMEWIGR